MKEYHGYWPTMITPFTENNTVDFDAIKKLVEWYIAHGADGIFAVCQSSEMFFLSKQEKLDIAKAVVDANAGRIKVIASGHTSDDHAEQIDELGAMAKTGVDAVVLVANRVALMPPLSSRKVNAFPSTFAPPAKSDEWTLRKTLGRKNDEAYVIVRSSVDKSSCHILSCF